MPAEFLIGSKNPYIGKTVTVTWKRDWGENRAGYTVTGKLKATYVVNRRTLIGEVICKYGVKVTCPWSRNFITIKVHENGKN